MLTATAFLIAFGTATALALFRHPRYGLYLYIAVFYLHPPSRWWSQMLPDLRWSLLAAAIAIVAVVLHRNRVPRVDRGWHRSLPGVALLSFVAWLWAQNLWALDPVSHLDASIQYTKYLLVFYLVYRLAHDPDEANDILLVHVAGCFYLGVLCFLSNDRYEGRLDGVGGPGINDANSLGMFLATGVAVGAILALSLKGWRRLAVIAALPFILNGLVLTGSRGAFLGLLAGGLVIYLLRPPEQRWVFWGMAMLGVLLAVRVVDQQFVERMLTIGDAVSVEGEIDGSAEGRLVLMKAQARMATRFPHGAGKRGTVVLSREYLERRWLTRSAEETEEQAGRSSHNTFMTVLVEQGIPGVVVYLCVLAWGIRAIVRLKSGQRRGTTPPGSVPAIACCAGMAVVWTAGQFTDYILAEVQIWLLALLAATLEQMRTEAARAPERQPPDQLLGAACGAQPGT